MSLGLCRNAWFRGLAVSSTIWLAGCEASVDAPNEPSDGASRQAATPSPAVSSAPAPAPSPTQEPSPASQPPNHPPTVTVTGGGSCYPRPCQIRFEADGQDPDGDALEYKWSGCASGGRRAAVCEVNGLGEFEATVKVTDGRGGKATGVGTARGVNDPPRLFIGFPTPLRPSALNFGVGYVTDEDQCGPRDIRTEISGACSRVETLCSSGGLDLELHTTAGPGECRVKVTFRDQWGAVGVASGTYPVAP
jgi:hypothetical protein